AENAGGEEVATGRHSWFLKEEAHMEAQVLLPATNNLLFSNLTTPKKLAESIMSAEVHLERQNRDDLRASLPPFAPALAPRVPTVTLISHRELREKHVAHRLQPGSIDQKLAASSHYRCSEGRSLSSYRTCFMKSSGLV
ncbi:hypothetical protein XENOCAPTIV_016354, partial [Xenoophorus captivus]